jgi:hypothetical protein
MFTKIKKKNTLDGRYIVLVIDKFDGGNGRSIKI